jgi:hypothetical protein
MKENRSPITQVLALLCLTVFALCVLLVLLTAASVYRNQVDRGEQIYTRRTALQYLTTRVRQAERVTVGDLEGCEALILEETIDEEVYTTWVYCHEGWIRELYAVPGAKLPPEAGEAIVEAEAFALQLEDSVLRIHVEEDGLILYLPEGMEVGP